MPLDAGFELGGGLVRIEVVLLVEESAAFLLELLREVQVLVLAVDIVLEVSDEHAMVIHFLEFTQTRGCWLIVEQSLLHRDLVAAVWENHISRLPPRLSAQLRDRSSLAVPVLSQALALDLDIAAHLFWDFVLRLKGPGAGVRVRLEELLRCIGVILWVVQNGEVHFVRRVLLYAGHLKAAIPHAILVLLRLKLLSDG